MKKVITYLFALLFAGSVCSCDDGKIYSETTPLIDQGGKVKLTARISGVESWPGDYSIVLAAFATDNEYAKSAKSIVPDKDGSVEIVLSGLTASVDRIEICAINKLRKRIASFYTADFTEQEDTLFLQAGTVDAGMFHSIQAQVFDKTCTACHGGSTTAAGGLKLTTGDSYNALVNVPAKLSEDTICFVTPGNAEESFLHLVLNTHLTENWRMDHIDMITSDDLLLLIDDWINYGAQE